VPAPTDVRITFFYVPGDALDPYINARPSGARGGPPVPEATEPPPQTVAPRATSIPPTAVPTITPEPGGGVDSDDTCVRGRAFLEGRADNSGMPVLVDGHVMAVTEPDGSFEACGLRQGEHQVTLGGGCFLPTEPKSFSIDADEVVELPPVDLVGGDVSGDAVIDMRDLMKMSTQYQLSPPDDPSADCTADGVVTKADLVLVATNYGRSGPVGWPDGANDGAADRSREGESGQDLEDGGSGAPMPFDAYRRRWHGNPDDVQVSIEIGEADSGAVEVMIYAHEAPGIAGAHLSLVYDPRLLSVRDASDRPGVQALPGEAWPDDGTSFVAVNERAPGLTELRFAASRLRPAEAASGDVHLLTVVFELVDGASNAADAVDRRNSPDASDIEGALDRVALSRVELYGTDGKEIAVRWQGVGLGSSAYLPALHLQR